MAVSVLSLLVFVTRKLHIFSLSVEANCDVGHPPTTSTLATSLSSNLVIALPIRRLPGEAQTCRKDLCLSNSKFQSQPVSHPQLQFSWQNDWQPADWGTVDFYALKSDSGGIQPITAQGHKEKVQRVDAIAGCTLTSHGAGARQRVQQDAEKRNGRDYGNTIRSGRLCFSKLEEKGCFKVSLASIRNKGRSRRWMTSLCHCQLFGASA